MELSGIFRQKVVDFLEKLFFSIFISLAINFLKKFIYIEHALED